jgi:CheY-like chemotaxis protein
LADVTQIQQAILNLATNALQAIPSGPGLIEVRVDVETLDQNLIATHPVLSALQRRHVERVVSLTVSDSGPGIPPDIIDRIFEPFFTTKPVNEGTGLGLSVVHGIVEAHEGVIDVKSPPGRGATFTIFLPTVVLGTAFKPSASPRSTGGNLAVKKASKANGLRVLFLDDDEAVLFLVSRLLERRGMQVTTIGNQQEALDLIRKDPKAFSVVVTDYNMPGMSGVDVARELREIRAELPVILVSGFVDDQVRETALAAGVKALVFKETIVEEFAHAIISAAESL